MRAALKIGLTLFAVLMLGPVGRAADCPLIVPVSDAGWYNAASFHDPDNYNYIVGYHAAGPTELRNFFVFDLPEFSGSAAGAQLRIFAFTINSAQTTETYELHHVSTQIETLIAGAGLEVTNVFNDLGDGAVFGTRAITNSEANGYITLTLNSNALAVINTSPGQRFALGGRVTSLAAADVDEKLFAFSSGTGPYVQLTLTFAGTNAPFIFAQPPPLIVTNSGSPVSLTVGGCGAEPLRYRWYFNGQPLNATNSTFTINSPNLNSSGEYFAVVSNAFGVITSGPSLLIVDGTPPAIYSLPATKTVAVGSTASFFPFVAGTPAPALQWFFAGLEIPGATNFYYEIPNVQPFHSAIVSLVASNLLGVVTNHAQLQVEPLLLAGPYDQSAPPGGIAYLYASVASSVPVTYQWRSHGTNLPGANGRFLTVTNVQLGISESYDVVVGNIYGSRTSVVATVSAYLPAQPQAFAPIITYPPRLGQDTVLRSWTEGALPLSFQWHLNGQPITGATNTDLMLFNFSVSQNGTYHYVVTNTFGAATSSVVNIIPEAERPVLYSIYGVRNVFTEQLVSLQSVGLGAPPPQFQWQRNGTNLPGATNSSLLFTNVTLADDGFYVLQASNFLGSESIGVHMNVQPRRALDRWTWRNSKPQANDLRHVASGNGCIVAGGEGGGLVTSTNGGDWITTPIGNQFLIERLVFGNGLFVALVSGKNDPDLLLISTNGVNWQPRSLPMFDAYTLDFANGEFFITGYVGSAPLRLIRSTDAQSWTVHAIPVFFGSSTIGMAYGNGRYVLAGPQTTLVSTDAEHWESYYVGMFPNRLTFGNGLFAVTTYEGEVWTSQDGRVWHARNTGLFAAPNSTINLQSIATGQGQFIAVGVNGTIARSANGQTWTAANATTTRDLRDVTFNGTQWIVSGNDGVLLTSPDGVTWTDRRNGRTRDLYGIIYTNNQFVAVGYEGTVVTSPDALTWTARSSGTSRDLHAITYANGLYVAGGRNGTIITSPNAINWTTRSTSTTNYIERIAWGGGRFVAAVTHGTILSSTNGINWQSHTHPAHPDAEFEGVAYGAGRFVMVGVFQDGNAHSIMLASSNGMDWISTTVDVGKGLRGVNYDGNQFLAVGNDGVVIFSETGLGWGSYGFVEPFENWRHVANALGRFIVVGNDGAVASFDNNAIWHPHASIVSQNLHDIAYGAGKFVAVGNAGTIVQSDFAVPFLSGPRSTNMLRQFHVSGGLEDDYRIEYSYFLTNWFDVGTYTNNGTRQTFSLEDNFPQGFFRVVRP
jgi:putative intracellular protease/amidase